MQTFETTLRGRSLWLAVVIPPVIYWTLVQVFAMRAGDVAMTPRVLALLVALANALPLLALGWMLCSVAAYTVAPGKLVEHRVVRDREFRLEALSEQPRVEGDTVVVKLGRRTLRLQVAHPEMCRQRLEDAQA